MPWASVLELADDWLTAKRAPDSAAQAEMGRAGGSARSARARVHAIALFNARYMDRAIGQVRDGDRTVDYDLERLPPLVRQHIELHGRHSFSLPTTVRTGELRPLPRLG